MQFGIYQHEYIFQRLTKLNEPARLVQFVVFEKYTLMIFPILSRGLSCKTPRGFYKGLFLEDRFSVSCFPLIGCFCF